MTKSFDAATASAEGERASELRVPGPLGVIDRAMKGLNHVILVLGGVALVVACVVLSYSVLSRHVWDEATDWQDETAVFLIVGATFLSAAGVQAKRGHVAIEAVSGLLPEGANRVRLLAADLISLAFVAFFAWKSWMLLHEAWVDGQTSQSTWGPPLWIPYSLMAVGMSLLTFQFVLQILEAVIYGPKLAGWGAQKIGIGADLANDLSVEDRRPVPPESRP
ncbi:MAG: TRAP transporter small permease [Hansschlegelia sp.]